MFKFNKIFNRKEQSLSKEDKLFINGRIAELDNQLKESEETEELKEINLNNELENLSGEDKLNKMREFLKMQEEKREKNYEKNELERELRDGKKKEEEKPEEPEIDLENIETKNTKKRTPEEELENSLVNYNLKDKMPKDFESLSIPKKMFVIEGIKKRIVDMVKTDAETQYSLYYKEKMKDDTKETRWLHQDIKKFAKTSKKGIQEAWEKETNIKNLENKIFNSLIRTKNGEELLKDNLNILVENAKDQWITLDENKKRTRVVYLDYGLEGNKNYTPKEAEVISRFNDIANEFRDVPYEWGQGKDDNKIVYEEIKKKYEKAKIEALQIRAKKEDVNEKGMAMLEISQIDSKVQMEQLLNTHPEFEKELLNLEKDAGVKERFKTLGKFANTITGKNATNRFLMLLGYTARGVSKGILAASKMDLLTASSTALISGTIGYFRGKLKAKETLEGRKKEARHGKKDESQEKDRVIDSIILTERMDHYAEYLEKATNEKDSLKRVDQLKRRILYTQGRIEQGLVNFGDSKESLANQFNFTNSLNRALVLTNSLEKSTRKDIDERLTQFLNFKAQRVHANQKEFIKEQAKKGILIGAGFATIGYGIRYVGENLGWWGPDGGKHLIEEKPVIEEAPAIPEEPAVPEEPPTPEKPEVTPPVIGEDEEVPTETIKRLKVTIPVDAESMDEEAVDQELEKKEIEKPFVEEKDIKEETETKMSKVRGSDIVVEKGIIPEEKILEEDMEIKQIEEIHEEESPVELSEDKIDEPSIPKEEPKMGPPTEEEYREPITEEKAVEEIKPVEVKSETIETSSNGPSGDEYNEPTEKDYKSNTTPEDRSASLKKEGVDLNKGDYKEPEGKAEISSLNPNGLNESQIAEVKSVSNENLSKVFGEKMSIWENIKDNSATDEMTSEGITEEKKYFIRYLNKLKDITKLEPRAETFTMRGETNAEYIKRALEYATKENKLNSLKL